MTYVKTLITILVSVVWFGHTAAAGPVGLSGDGDLCLFAKNSKGEYLNGLEGRELKRTCFAGHNAAFQTQYLTRRWKKEMPNIPVVVVPRDTTIDVDSALRKTSAEHIAMRQAITKAISTRTREDVFYFRGHSGMAPFFIEALVRLPANVKIGGVVLTGPLACPADKEMVTWRGQHPVPGYLDLVRAADIMANSGNRRLLEFRIRQRGAKVVLLVSNTDKVARGPSWNCFETWATANGLIADGLVEIRHRDDLNHKQLERAGYPIMSELIEEDQAPVVSVNETN